MTFGINSIPEYLDAAFEFLLEKPKPGIEIRYDKVKKTYRKYDKNTNTLISYENGKVVTFFKPAERVDNWNEVDEFGNPKNGKLIKSY